MTKKLKIKPRRPGQWQTLDAKKVQAGLAIVAASLGRELRSPRGYSSVEDLEERLTPYSAFAELTLMAGAFGYPKKTKPTNSLVIEVMLDFMRATGVATVEDELRLRSALLAPIGTGSARRRS